MCKIWCVVLLIASTAGSGFGADGEPLAGRRTEVRNRMDAFVRTLREKGDASREARREIEAYELLMKNDSTVAECEEAVVRFVRQCYAERYPARGPGLLTTPGGVAGSDLPSLLYLFKGSTLGLFEYTRLTNRCAAQVDELLNGDPAAAEPSLIAYKVYCFTRWLDLGTTQYYGGAAHPVLSDLNGLLAPFATRYQKAPLVQNLVSRYPFERQSYLALALSSPLAGHQIDAIGMLLTYYDQVLSTTEQRSNFLQGISKHYGVDVAAAVVSRIVDRPELKREPAELIRVLLVIAVQGHDGPLASKISSLLPQADVIETVVARRKRLQQELDILAQLEAQATATPATRP